MVAEARAATGLSDFGDDSLLDRLAAQAAAVDADTGLSGLGRHLVRARLVGLLAARLRFEDYFARHPEALDVELEPPVIVVGLPRSGTTHLVNLLAADSPVPLHAVVGGDRADPGAPATARVATASTPATCAASRRLRGGDVGGAAGGAHARPAPVEHRGGLRAHRPRPRAPTRSSGTHGCRRWRDHYLTLDQHRHYAFLRRELQVLSHLRGPNRWVLKTPQHLEQLGPLLATFPDATIAFTLRDPVAVLQSAITMLAYGDRMRRVTVDADAARRLLGRPHRTAPAGGGARRRTSSPRRSGSTWSSASSWPTTSPWPTRILERRRDRGHRPGPHRARPPTSPATRAARMGASSTTCAATSGSNRPRSTSASPSTTTRSRRSAKEVH